MPKKMHDALMREGKKKGFTGKRLKKYVYGGMYNRGWRKGRKTLLKGSSKYGTS